ncbi:MAG: DNA (cytosine-5-)-methyltransferase [Anaerolineae bacterium]|jgi:DNA (cytosine-5)-methyltransferase 1|nr:DNA (cytosine-5-)-methyltransferase [Anaerolineae bacterium]
MTPKLDLRSLRLSKKIRQRDLAEALNIQLVELRKIEKHLTTPPETLLKQAANFLNVDLQDLLTHYSKQPATVNFGEGYTTGVTKEYFSVEAKTSFDKNRIPILDLFCGSGGFSHGFELTNQFKVCAALDLLPDRVHTFAQNHPDATTFCADIQKFDISKLESLSNHPRVIIGGPPCQGFSSIRPFRALIENDPRNNLFENFAIAVNIFKPEWFFLENVVGLISHQKGQTLQAIIQLFEQLNYTVEWKVLNAALFGLPQRRERLIIVGNANGKKFRWPAPTHLLDNDCRSMVSKQYDPTKDISLSNQKLFPSVTIMQAIHDLPELDAGQSSDRYRNDIIMTAYEEKMRGQQTQLTLHQATFHSPQMLEIIKKSGFNKNALPNGMVKSGFSTSYSRLEPDKPSVTLTVNFVHPSSNRCIHPYQQRALTPREGARLQGFEDSYRFWGTRTQIVKQIGNAVPPIFGQVLAYALLEQW